MPRPTKFTPRPMPRASAARVKCPRPEHGGWRVKLDGTYGKPGHRRQRYRCSPRGGGRPHVFTELLPREESWRDSCEQGERHVERRQGPKAPRHYRFVARGIAEALHAVGSGATYMRASRVARDRARRFRFDWRRVAIRVAGIGRLVVGVGAVHGPAKGGPATGRNPTAREGAPASPKGLKARSPVRQRAGLPAPTPESAGFGLGQELGG